MNASKYWIEPAIYGIFAAVGVGQILYASHVLSTYQILLTYAGIVLGIVAITGMNPLTRFWLQRAAARRHIPDKAHNEESVAQRQLDVSDNNVIDRRAA